MQTGALISHAPLVNPELSVLILHCESGTHPGEQGSEMVTQGLLLPVSNHLCEALDCTGTLPRRRCGQVVSVIPMGSQTSAGEAVYHRTLKIFHLIQRKPQALNSGTSLTGHGKLDQGCILSLGFKLKQLGLRSPADHSLTCSSGTRSL